MVTRKSGSTRYVAQRFLEKYLRNGLSWRHTKLKELLVLSEEGSDITNNALDWNTPTMSKVRDTPVTNNHGSTNSPTQ